MNQIFNYNKIYKILIISHRYYPNTNARAFRWTALAEYWADKGHTIDVISLRTNGSLKQVIGDNFLQNLHY